MNANETTTRTYNRRPSMDLSRRLFSDAGRLATQDSDKIAADGYRDGLEGRDRLAEVVDGADRIVYRSAHASGRLDRETAHRAAREIPWQPYRVRRIEGGKYVADLIRFAPSMERAVSDARKLGPEWVDAGLLVEPCDDPRKNQDGSWKFGPNAAQRVTA